MTEAFLRVQQSFTGRLWLSRPYDERAATALAQRHALPDLIAKSLSARGIGLEEAPSFLLPTLRELMPDPSRFKDMDKAVTRTLQAIENGDKITVFGDYDVDGATSAALLIRFGQALGVKIRLYVPDRFTEGYGPNAKALEMLAAEGCNLVLCVDCGTTAFDALKAARQKALDVIILDHHAPEAELPAAFAIVNPNRLDEDKIFGTLAAVGVTYLFIVALNRALREQGYYKGSRAEPDLRNFLDLVALGTVCDVVRLEGLNRAFVSQGLKVMAQRKNRGLEALAKVAGHKGVYDAFSAGFLLGPRVNAGGRVGQSDLGAQLLSTESDEEAALLAERLHTLNLQRRSIEAAILAEAEALTFGDKQPLIFVASTNWHAGVIGIVASRLKDKSHRPALVVALDGELGKGSGRSVTGLDLGAQIIAARQAGLLINGGGHAMAAGFTVPRDKLNAFRDFMIERVGKIVAAEPLKPTLMLDGLVTASALEPEFVRKLSALGPYGSGNSEPRFALADCRLIRADVVGEKHVSVIVMQGGKRFRGIAFRAMDSDLGEALLASTHKNIFLAGHLRLDEWQGNERVQLHISDAAAMDAL